MIIALPGKLAGLTYRPSREGVVNQIMDTLRGRVRSTNREQVQIYKQHNSRATVQLNSRFVKDTAAKSRYSSWLAGDYEWLSDFAEIDTLYSVESANRLTSVGTP